MHAARVSKSSEQWIELPAPNLTRHLLRGRPRAANDNRGLSLGHLPILPFGACVALSGAVTLIVALIR